MARWTASAKWGEAPALAGWRATPLGVRLNEGLGVTGLASANSLAVFDQGVSRRPPLRLALLERPLKRGTQIRGGDDTLLRLVCPPEGCA
jgi:hypothetical protein